MLNSYKETEVPDGLESKLEGFTKKVVLRLRFSFPKTLPCLTMWHQSPGRPTSTSSAQGLLRLIFLELQWVCRKTNLNFQWA